MLCRSGMIWYETEVTQQQLDGRGLLDLGLPVHDYGSVSHDQLVIIAGGGCAHHMRKRGSLLHPCSMRPVAAACFTEPLVT